MTWQILEGDCRTVLATLPAGSVQTCVTSPPYFGLRDYGTGQWDGGNADCDHLGPPFRTKSKLNENWSAGYSDVKNAEGREPMGQTCTKCGAGRIDQQIGLEPTPDEFVAALVAVFREVRRVLRDDGTVWLNLGDSYAAGKMGRDDGGRSSGTFTGNPYHAEVAPKQRAAPEGCKPKDLLGIPWLVAFALRADGWYLRSDIIWAKPNPMPESVTDRPTKAHEYVFLLSKGPRYFYDADAIREGVSDTTHGNRADFPLTAGDLTRAPVPPSPRSTLRNGSDIQPDRNRRSVWTVATQPYPGAHFATFPPKLIEPCILAGSPAGGIVLDPFAGAGTTGMVALRHDRSFIGIELSTEYAELARWRIRDDAPLLNTHAEEAA